MDVQVAPLADAPAESAAWDRYVDAHPDATIYHYFAWRRIFAGSFGYRCWMLAARAGAGGNIVGVLPLYLVRTPFTRRLVAAPFRDRGGILCDTPAAFEALARACNDIAASTGATTVRLKSLIAYPEPQAGALGLTEQRYWVHSVVKLEGRTSAKLWDEIGDKNRNMVRQAQRQGLRCGPLPVSPESLTRWHRLHVATQKRLGLPPFPRAFFAAMSDELYAAGRFALFGVHRGAELHAATILLLHGPRAIYAYSASDAAGQRWRANDLMLFEVMQWLIERRCAAFDLGSDSPQQENLLFFKRKWLAEQSVIPHYVRGDAAPIDSSNAAYVLARKCFGLLPAPLLTALGAAVVGYFG